MSRLALGAFTALMAPLVIAANPATADDAYVCDGGRLVYARPETLEKLKKTDPCIQKYYQDVPASLAAVPIPEPVLAERAEPSIATAPPVSAPSRNQQGQSGNSVMLKGSKDTKRAPADSKDKEARAKRPEQAPGTDFRNVQVINSPDSAIYRHER